MSIQDYATQSAESNARAAAAQQDHKNKQVWEEDILPRYDIKDFEANFRMCVDFSNGDLTLGKFEFLISNTPPGFSLVFGDERQDLLDKIQEKLADPYGRRMTTFDLKTQMKKFSTFNRMELRAKLAEITRRQELSKKTATELRADNAAYYRAQENQLYPGFPTLASTIVPPGQIQAVSTREYLQHLAKHDLYGFKRMIRLYGSQQCDDIRLGRR